MNYLWSCCPSLFCCDVSGTLFWSGCHVEDCKTLSSGDLSTGVSTRLLWPVFKSHSLGKMSNCCLNPLFSDPLCPLSLSLCYSILKKPGLDLQESNTFSRTSRKYLHRDQTSCVFAWLILLWAAFSTRQHCIVFTMVTFTFHQSLSTSPSPLPYCYLCVFWCCPVWHAWQSISDHQVSLKTCWTSTITKEYKNTTISEKTHISLFYFNYILIGLCNICFIFLLPVSLQIVKILWNMNFKML